MDAGKVAVWYVFNVKLCKGFCMAEKARSGKVTEQTLLGVVQRPLKDFLKFISSIKPPKLPETKGMKEPQLYDVYAKYVESNGDQDAKDALQRGDQVIVALRIINNTRDNRGRGLYDDRMVILWQEPGKTPVKHCKEYKANTEPSAQYEQRDAHFVQSKSKGKQVKVVHEIYGPDGKKVDFSKNDGQDVDGNKRLDLGRLQAGNYKFYNAGGTFLGGAYLRPRGSQTAQRDTNHDGVFDSKDAWETPSGNVLMHVGDFAMYIHKGGAANTWSAGCQTLPPHEHAAFFKTLNSKKPKQSDYSYVLVEMEWEWDGKK